jgi:ParB family transcriptional regulator, chromosome partitioning protein
MTYELTPHGTVRISDVIVPDDHREVDQESVSWIAESIRVNGLLHPIVVRRRAAMRVFGKMLEPKILLVAGAYRLKAAELAGLKEVACIFLEGDGRRARLVAIEENLFRKDLTALKRAEQLAEWVEIAMELEDSGQKVLKPKGGRPEGGIAKVARELPISGKTKEARRKTAERAIKINELSPEAKKAAEELNLDDRTAALLVIAKEKSPAAQVKKARELANRKSDTGAKRRSRGMAKAASKTALSGGDKEALERLIEAWNAAGELKRAFIKASPNVRERFIAAIQA